jgi:hypothetical protein
MNAIILKGAALRQPPLPQSGPRAKTIAHPWFKQKLLRRQSFKLGSTDLQGLQIVKLNRISIGRQIEHGITNEILLRSVDPQRLTLGHTRCG